MYKIAIIAPPDCYRESVVRDFMIKVKNNFGNTATILSGGNLTGVETIVKWSALEYDMKYIEYNPACTQKNVYSALRENFYKKKYHYTHYIHRYQLLLRDAERLVIVKQEDSKDWKPIYENIHKKAQKNGIKSVLI